jgi:hypothetical protein
MEPPPIPKSLLTAVNRLYELEYELKKHSGLESLQRKVSKMKDAFEDCGLVFEDPMGQSWNQTRTDLDASIAGAGTENLAVVEVIKPIIRFIQWDGGREVSKVVQPGIVVVESRKEQ